MVDLLLVGSSVPPLVACDRGRLHMLAVVGRACVLWGIPDKALVS